MKRLYYEWRGYALVFLGVTLRSWVALGELLWRHRR